MRNLAYQQIFDLDFNHDIDDLTYIWTSDYEVFSISSNHLEVNDLRNADDVVHVFTSSYFIQLILRSGMEGRGMTSILSHDQR